MSRDLSPHAIRRLLDAAAPLADDPHEGVLDLERYELFEELGRGGMGVVYAAWDRELERKVALKVLGGAAGISDEARSRFLREAKAAARLVHPHIATVYDATPEVIAMQLVGGTTLAERGRSDPRSLAALIRDAALAIHFAHGEGIVHRDLKPGNLMVEETDRPHVFVMDFGLAKERAVDSSVSLSGSIIGTPAFMAPEQAAGRTTEVGPRTDVYGLGATLYACLAGRPPFEHEDVYQLLRRVVEEDPPPLTALVPRIDRDLSIIVQQCLEKDPLRRYASALALASDLDRWLSGEPIQARPPSVLYRFRRFVSRRQGAVIVGVVAALLAFLVALPFLVQERARRESAERVLVLSERIVEALRDARSARTAGAGRESAHWEILEEAANECRAFLDETELGHVWFFLGELRREQGRYEEALSAFDRSEELSPDLENLPRERGLTLAALYRSGVAIGNEGPLPELDTWRERGAGDLARALEVAPDRLTLDWLYAAGQLAWLEGDLDRAIALHREVTEMDGAHRQAHLSLSRLYLLVDRVDLAMRHGVLASDLLRGIGPAYVTGQVRSASGEPILPSQELLPLMGMRELLVDFSLLLQLDPGEANTYGLRGQVLVRNALRAIAAGDQDRALGSLDDAIIAFDAALGVEAGHAPALLSRGVSRTLLGRALAGAGESSRSAAAFSLAGADYREAIAADGGLAAAHFDLALLEQHRARLERMALRPDRAGLARERARTSAHAALASSDVDHPFRERFAELARELD